MATKYFKRAKRSMRSMGKKRSGRGIVSAKKIYDYGSGTRAWWRNSYNPTASRFGRQFRTALSKNSREAANCLHVAMHPFSDRTNMPRFPDGKVDESVGLQYKVAAEFQQRTSATGSLELVFFPGLNCCVTVNAAVSNQLGLETTPENQFEEKIITQPNHVTGSIQDNGTSLVFTQQRERQVAKWRGVSYGMRILCLNNEEEADGHFKACRITPSNSLEDYGVSFSPGATSQPLYLYHKMPQLTVADILNQRSFTMDRLASIGQYIFQLNPENQDREFVDLSESVTLELGAGTPTTLGMPFDGLILPDGGSSYTGRSFQQVAMQSSRIQDEAISQFVDLTFDAIYVKIFGRDGSAGRLATNLHVLCFMNQELVYDEKAHNTKFHQRTVYHSGHKNVKGIQKAGHRNRIPGLSYSK